MPDLWVDVDTAVIVPVNIMPLLDDTDFKTIETAVVYNSAGLALTWNFVTPAGVVTGTAVTPTTAGVYDWSEPIADKGMYAIEIPASGGVSINNNTEGVGWFTGVATGVLPWRGPTIGFRRAALNDLLIEGSTASTNMEDFFDGTGYAGGTAKLKVDVDTIKTQAVTCAAGVTVLASVGTAAASTAQTGDSYALANGANGFVAIKGDTAAILLDTGTDGVVVAAASKTGYALSAAGVQAIWDALTSALTTIGSIGKKLADWVIGSLNADQSAVTIGTVTNVGTVTGNVNGSVASVTGAVGSVTGAVGSVTGAVGSVTAGVTIATGGIGSGAHAAAELNAIADGVLDRNMATGTDSGTDSTVTRTPRQALRMLRNKKAVAAGVLTVRKEDDTTASWTAAVATTAGDPVSSIDPT